jgi:hypothetical protein
MAIRGERGVVFAMLTMPECEQGRTLGGGGGGGVRKYNRQNLIGFGYET